MPALGRRFEKKTCNLLASSLLGSFGKDFFAAHSRIAVAFRRSRNIIFAN